MAPFKSCLPLWNSPESATKDEAQAKKDAYSRPSGNTVRPQCRIEDYRPGYPRFTALVSAYERFFLCRRFDKLRARLLLLKQDRLSQLEQRLEQVDREEVSPLFLGMSRSDRNMDRLSLLSAIESCLADYDKFAERTQRILSFGVAQDREVESLQNWVTGNGSLAREETEYLTHRRELVSLAPSCDSAMMQFESWVEDKFIRFCRAFRKSHYYDVSTDTNVYIYSGLLIKRTAKALLLLLITLLLLMPIVICNILSTIAARIMVVIAFTISYLLILSGLTRSRTIELIVAGTTYATVLTVFVSGTSGI